MGADEDSAAVWRRQLADLWARRRPAILARVDQLEALAAAEAPDATEIEAGRVEAHKLRGLLGTIGLPAGSEAAGEVEDLLAEGNLAIAEPLGRLAMLVREHQPA
jgi:HPt (histidine-containing phosphotransfer) domain-containing protein